MHPRDDMALAETLATTIAEYSALGWHRTGSAGDEATSHWLIEMLSRLGFAARLAPFAFPRVETTRACLIAGSECIEGTLLHDGGFTGAEGITAPLLPIERCAPGAIALMASAAGLDPHAQPALRGEQRAAGAVLVSGDPEGHVLLRNAERLHEPLPAPVLQLGRRAAASLTDWAARAAPVTLVAQGTRATGRATNVVATLAGEGPPIVLLTPKSGWFQCAAERGSGIAIVLALAAYAVHADHAAQATSGQAKAGSPAPPAGGPRRPLRLLFTSGHELGYVGLKALLAGEPDMSAPGVEWMHVGASLGARAPIHTFLFSHHALWRERLAAALARQGITDIKLPPPGAMRPLGEGSVIAERPERAFISTMGTHSHFHSPQDLPHIAVDPTRAARFALAWRELFDFAWARDATPAAPAPHTAHLPPSSQTPTP